MNLEVVQVLQDFRVHNHHIRKGARVTAWRKSGEGWVVCFNGDDIPVPEGTVGAVDSGHAEANAQPTYSAARLEQYQVAPAQPK